jgi:hypothetical protein
VHKETITTVPNAKDHRNALKPDIIGMEGVPPDAVRGSAAAGSDDEVRFSGQRTRCRIGAFFLQFQAEWRFLSFVFLSTFAAPFSSSRYQ